MTDLPVTDDNGKVLRAHIHRHGAYGAAFTPNLMRCRCSVNDGGRWPRWSQCKRKVAVQRVCDDSHGCVETYGFCKTHDPVAVYEKAKARDAAWQEKWDRDRLAHARANDRPKQYVEALRAIAAGHNDARQCAKDALAIWGDEQ